MDPQDQAEAELLELIRLEDAQNFTLTIRVDKGQWMVATHDHYADAHGRGHGNSFAEAWYDQVGPDLRDRRSKETPIR